MKPILQRAQELALPPEQREAFDQRIEGALSESDANYVRDLVRLAADMATHLGGEMGMAKLRRMIFGPKTESTRNVFPPEGEETGKARPGEDVPCGHGRNAEADYPGARTRCVKHPKLKRGQICPKCGRGRLARHKPANRIQVKARPPLEATRFQLEQLRCAVCGALYTAPLPEGVVDVKYDDSVGVMIGFLRFGAGVPNYRLARMQEMAGVPMPESTQWQQMYQSTVAMRLVFGELKHEAAQAALFHIDDTKMRVAELKQKMAEAPTEAGKRTRTGIFTSVILSLGTKHSVCLYFTGNRYAAERMEEIMVHREPGLKEPIQMSDALSWNGARGYSFLEALCLTHGRREFVDVVKYFPAQTRRVIEDLREVYRTDAEAKENELSTSERLRLHQEKSGPIMKALREWMEEELASKRVEPNSGLGGAMKYLLKHWEGLTLFLRVAGAPLDNTIAERAIKRAVLHRKNSMSYLTERGAEVGDLYMSLIETCRMNGVNPYEYLLALVGNEKAVALAPEKWMPWNYPRPPEAIAA